MAPAHHASIPDATEALIGEGAAILRAAGLVDARFEARLLLRVAEDRHGACPSDRREAFRALVGRRAGGEPFAYIAGVREFWSLDFQVGPATLIPRPDSEVVVETALAWGTTRGGVSRVLDLGTGSGCLLIALLSALQGASGLGIDCSPTALALARENAARHGLADRIRFVCGNWADGLAGPFDAIVCNPPYVRSRDIAHLDRSVRDYEPRLALDGGDDGLDPYRVLAAALPRLLARNGAVFVEIGAGQAGAVAAIMEGRGIRPIAAKPDLQGELRCLGFARDGLQKSVGNPMISD